MTLLAFTIAATLGIGGPLILLPFLMLQFSLAESIALIVPSMFVNNIGRLVIFRKDLQLKPALTMLIFAIPLAIVGSFLTGKVSPILLKGLIIGVIAYLLINRYILAHPSSKISTKGLLLWAIPTGFISGLSGTAGPPMALALRGYGLVLKQFVATAAFIQASLQIVRLPGYFSSGLLSHNHWLLAITMALFSFPAIFISRKILNKLKPNSFRVALDVVLGMIGLMMLGSLVRSFF